MRVIKIGDAELEAAKAELADIVERGFGVGIEITQELVCDECGATGQQMLRIEASEEKRPHDICDACLTKGLKLLADTTEHDNAATTQSI